MTINQLSVFVQNKAGTVAAITKSIAQAGVSIRALSVADTQEFGILRLIVSDTQKAQEALSKNECVVSITKVIGVQIPDTPGGLAKMLSVLSSENVSVEYMYAFCTRTHGKAMMVLTVDDSVKAQKVLAEKGYGDVDPKEFFKH